MIKVKIIATGEVKEVSRNEAHSLIEAKKALLIRFPPPYNTGEMRPERPSKGYKTK